jgi:hypothetical protein
VGALGIRASWRSDLFSANLACVLIKVFYPLSYSSIANAALSGHISKLSVQLIFLAADPNILEVQE